MPRPASLIPSVRRLALISLLAGLGLLTSGVADAHAGSGSGSGLALRSGSAPRSGSTPRSGSALAGAASGAPARLLTQLEVEYRQGFASHNEVAARHVRAMAGAAQALAGAVPAGRRADTRTPVARLDHLLAATRFTLQIWPYPEAIIRQVDALRTDLGLRGGRPPALATPAALSATAQLIDAARTAADSGQLPRAQLSLAEGYATFAATLAQKLDAVAPEQVGETETDLMAGLAATTPAAAARAAARSATMLHDDAASLGQISVSRATIVSDAAIILFREGLEAVLILAAITASFTGARRRLRRLVLAGAGVGLVATAITYVLAQVIIDALGDGGLRLQAITGILAIIVLLVVTNWFFHKVYWSEWIARFNRRRKTLEKVDKLGFISGQALGFIVLGLTSVYREGLETVLFLQNLQVSAGTGATLFGVAIGLGATLVVGIITFALGRKLPYKKMLIMTGVLIGLVLAVMVGTTMNNLQGLGWVPSSSAGFSVDLRLSQWTGFYPTWEGIGAQIASLLVVYGSYAVARQIQGLRRRRAVALHGSTAAVTGE